MKINNIHHSFWKSIKTFEIDENQWKQIRWKPSQDKKLEANKDFDTVNMSFLTVLSSHATKYLQIHETYEKDLLESLKVFETLMEIQQSAETY